MSFTESLLVAIFCMTFVFVVLAILCLTIKLFSLAAKAIQKRNTSSAASLNIEPDSEEADDAVYGGTLRLQNVDERTAAMIMAIVSDESGIPLSELRFQSIRLLEKE